VSRFPLSCYLRPARIELSSSNLLGRYWESSLSGRTRKAAVRQCGLFRRENIAALAISGRSQKASKPSYGLATADYVQLAASKGRRARWRCLKQFAGGLTPP